MEEDVGSDDGLQGCKRRWLKGWVEKVGYKRVKVLKKWVKSESKCSCVQRGVCCEEEDISSSFTYGRQGRER